MEIDVTVTIGGEAGQGILTVGNILTTVCRNAGLFVLGINEFESRIRGGHSFFQVRISDRPVAAPDDKIHLLVALNEESYELHKDQLADGGRGLMEKSEDIDADNLITIPISEISEAAGGDMFTNTVAAGAALALLGAPLSLCRKSISQYFNAKGNDVVEKNSQALKSGFEAVENEAFEWSFKWAEADPAGAIRTGGELIALGALAGDCRFGAFYPMSPATGIMAELIAFSDRFPLIVEQAEDEIAAVNMVIGASYAGARAMTATSGGGFSLMTEGLGLAGITETPIVIINAQRPGPATGMPTRTAQGDLHFVIRASQGEFPRFVFAPGTPRDVYESTARAFHLADKYQVPAIVLVDKYFTDSLYTVETDLTVPESVDRFIVTDEDMEDPKAYKRYALTASGISPRALPCAGEALVLVSGDEHREDGHVNEDARVRKQMEDKRNAKLSRMMKEMNSPKGYREDCEYLLVGWGSTEGAMREAVDMLKRDGIDAGCLTFIDLWPFPSRPAEDAIIKGKKFFMVELNRTAQLGQLIKQETGLGPSGAVLKYDGRPFYPAEIASGIKKYLEGS